MTDSTFTYYNPYSGVLNCSLLNKKIIFAVRNTYPGTEIIALRDGVYRIPGSGQFPLDVSIAADESNAGGPFTM